MKKALSAVVWLGVIGLGVMAYATMALHRGESLNSVYLLLAALCTMALGYRFYSKWIETKALFLDDSQATPAVAHEDGRDFVKTPSWVAFGQHYAAISGPGPLVGPVLAAQFGYLPGTLWILIGAVLGGAVQDFILLAGSLRRGGKSLGEMIREEISGAAGMLALIAAVLAILILLAVMAMVLVTALAGSPWGVFTVGATIPIALLLAGTFRSGNPGRLLTGTLIGGALLAGALWGGQWVQGHESLSKLFTLGTEPLAWGVIAYAFIASVLPIWLMLVPRGYLTMWVKLGTLLLLISAIAILLPDLTLPAVTPFIDGSGPVLAGKLFPFCFITIACGAISGFHSLIASGTTPKLLTRERLARPIGYGAMGLESLVAVVALIAACTLDPGVYFAMNMPGEPAAVVQKISTYGYAVTEAEMQTLAQEVGEESLFGRTGGATTLALGMAQLLSGLTGRSGMALWYHFAIMVQALFLLSMIDTGTRVGRYLLQDLLGGAWKPLADTKSTCAALLASALIVSGWGALLLQGLRNPQGGLPTLWPLFGIANYLLAILALCLATTLLLKAQLCRSTSRRRAPFIALIPLLPLIALLTLTLSTAQQKLFSDKPSIGFLAQARSLKAQTPQLGLTLAEARTSAEVEAAEAALKRNKTLQIHQLIKATVLSLLILLVVAVVLLSLREWARLLRRELP